MKAKGFRTNVCSIGLLALASCTVVSAAAPISNTNAGLPSATAYSTAVSNPSYYVSGSNGNDSWSGLLASPNSARTDGPFQTIGRAQNAMRGSGTIKAVILRAGIYSIAPNLPFDWSDNSEAWSAFPGENPTFDGSGKGVITLTGVKNVALQGITFQNMGVGGIITNGASGTSITGNTFNNCNTNCISGGGFSNSVIDSNTINGQTSVDSAIKLWYGSSNDKVTHNLIQNCQGGGINFETGDNDPPSNNVIIDRNILINVNISSFDQGAIYLVDRTHNVVGNQVTNNVIQGNGGGSLTSQIKGIYLDDLMSNTLISGNICSGCGQYAFQVHGGDRNTIVNNIFDLSSGAQLGFYQASPVGDYGMVGNVVTKNLVYSSRSVPSPLNRMEVSSKDGMPGSSDNLYYSATGSNTAPQGLYDGSPVFSNPQFAQPSSMNYSMPASSPAYTQVGFQPLPTDQGPLNKGTGGGVVVGPFLTGSVNSSNGTVNLTAEGTLDWAHWGTTSYTQKAGVTPVIGHWSIIGFQPANYYQNDPRAVTFTDGIDGGVAKSATLHDGIYVNGQSGLSFTAPAGTTPHTLTVHVGGYLSGGRLTAHLSDRSAADFIDTTGAVSGQYDRNYTLNYKAGSNGQIVTVSWVRDSGTGNVTLNGAALK